MRPLRKQADPTEIHFQTSLPHLPRAERADGRLKGSFMSVKICRWLMLALPFAVTALPGCALQDGFQDGLTQGTSHALAALIEAPVKAWVEQMFGE